MSLDFISEFLSDAERKNLKRNLRVLIPVSARESIVEGRSCIDFSSNNYLALSGHPKLKEESINWIRKFGVGSKASRLVTGTFAAYVELEERIARWKGTESAMIIGSGYLANTGLIPALADRRTEIFADKLNHASLNSGAMLSGAVFNRYRHMDLPSLEKMLSRSQADRKLIVTDTIFSMDGDLVEVADFENLSLRYDSLLYFDDAHATGIFGARGQGLACGAGKNRICMGTFSKAMGSYGAYVGVPSEMKEYLVNKCQSFIFSTALPPGVYGAISAAVELVQTLEFCEIRKKLLEKSAWLAGELRRLGFDTASTRSPIIPVMIGDSEKAVSISQFLFERGMLAIAIRPPTVPRDSARLRISLNAAHTDDDFGRLLEAMAETRKKF